MKILILAKGFPPSTGGLEKYSEELALCYSRKGHQVKVITSHSGEKKEYSINNVNIINVGEGSQFKVFVGMVLAIFKYTARDFDFIHATSWRVAIPSLLLRKKYLTVSIHGREVFVVPWILKPIMYFVLFKANLIVSVSKPILTRLKKKIPFKLESSLVAWNGISCPPKKVNFKEKINSTRIFCMCRLVERKNIIGAIKALAILDRSGVEFTFHIAGNGPQINVLQNEINQNSLNHKIKLLGRISDDQSYQEYAEASIFLHPQITTNNGGDIEGFGITIADSMSFGCVAIAGENGGPSDFISSGENGILVDSTRPESIAIAVHDLLCNKSKRQRIAKQGYSFSKEELTWDSHCEMILSHVQKP